MESKINLWYLDAGNLGDDYSSESSQKIVEAEIPLGLKTKFTKSEIVCPVCITEKQQSTIIASFLKHLPGVKTPTKKESNILGTPFANRSQTYWKGKLMNWKKVLEFLKNCKLTMVFYVEKLLQSAKLVVVLEKPVHDFITQLARNGMTTPHATGIPKCVT